MTDAGSGPGHNDWVPAGDGRYLPMDDDDLSPEDHVWLDQLTRECAIDFAAEQDYDLRDYVHGGCVAGWWGFTWMILAEARGVLTPEKRAAAWCRHGERTWGASKRAP